jgi:hypothetical protein
METTDLDNDLVKPDQRWNRVINICMQCPYDSSKGIWRELLEVSKSQIQRTDEDKLKQIQECHDSPDAGHPVRAQTEDLLIQSHSSN